MAIAMKEAYQIALDWQLACNASGLVRSLAQLTEALWNEARENKQGTDYVNKHPVMILFVEQLAHLTGCTLNHPKYSEASEACEKGARGE
jgi:hypothetical protein